MKIFFVLIISILGMTASAATDWSAKLNTFVLKKYSVPKDKIKTLPLPEAKAEVKKSVANFYSDLSIQYKTDLKLDYSPFGNKWQLGRIDMELAPLTTVEQLISEDFENKLNEILATDYKDFIASEFVISNHKVFDHETEIYNLKKEIIFLNQQIALLKKDAETKETPPAQEPVEIPYYLFAVTLLGSAGISVLIKKSKKI